MRMIGLNMWFAPPSRQLRNFATPALTF